MVTFWETIESLGPSTLYSCDDGITRLRRLGAPTATISRFVSVTHRHISEREWVEQSRSSAPHSSTPQSKTTHSETPQSKPPEREDPEPNYDDGGPSCELYHPHRFCPQNVTDLNALGLTPDNVTSNLPIDCYDSLNECGAAFDNDEVVLIYWPPNGIHTKDLSGDLCGVNRTWPRTDDEQMHRSPRIATVDEITFRGQDMYSRSKSTLGGTFHGRTNSGYAGMSIMKGPFTFTSPTIYVAHHPITFYHTSVVRLPAGSAGYEMAVPVPRKVDNIMPSGILELHATDVFSIRANRRTDLNDFEYARLVASGKYTPEESTESRYGSEEVNSVPFNFANLQDPVPASVYFDARADDCWYEQSHCQTITDGSYRPRLVLGSEVWKKHPQVHQQSCYIPNLVDPPLALEPIGDESRVAMGPNRPLPKILREPKPSDQNMAAFATATDADHPRGTSIPLEPGPIPSKFWPAPTATSGSTTGSTRGKDMESEPGVLGPKGTRPGPKGGSGYEPSNNGGVVFTSGSSGAHTLLPGPVAWKLVYAAVFIYGIIMIVS
jgi:hypothetical protein